MCISVSAQQESRVPNGECGSVQETGELETGELWSVTLTWCYGNSNGLQLTMHNSN